MPYSTPMQITVLDDLAARLGLEDPDAWVREMPMFASEPPIHGLADLTDTDAALLILMWRRELEAKQQVWRQEVEASQQQAKASAKRLSKKTPG